MINQNKFFAIVFINLMLISAFYSCSVNALDYVPVATVYTDAEDMLTRFSVWALTGEVSADGTSFGSSCEPALTHYSEYEYYTFVLYAKDNPVVEIAVPDTYMGIDVELWNGSAYVLRTGNASFTLSVPCNFNSTSAPPADWGTMPLAQPSGSVGSLRRVILAVNNTALGVDEAKLRITNHYATSPAVGFDGVNDKVEIPDGSSIETLPIVLNTTMKMYRRLGAWHCYIEKASVYRIGFNGINYFFGQASNSTLLTFADYSSESASEGVVYQHCLYYDGAKLEFFQDGISNGATAASPDLYNNAHPLRLGSSSGIQYYPVIFYDVALKSGGVDSVKINASSFSGGPNTTVTDLSGAGNHGTAYGNVQYKANLINGYQLTYITLVASINVNETVINWYGEMEVLAALVVVLAFFIITLFAYYKMQNSTMVLLSAVFALMVNVLSLSSGIPFSPFPQLFLSIVELMLLVYARRMNI